MFLSAIPSQPLPGSVRQNLYPLPREQWRDHDHFLASDARPLLRNHASLKKQARQYHGALNHLSNLSYQDRQSDDTRQLLPAIQQHLQSLLRNLHSHHGFEDSTVFPAIRLKHPRLNAAIDLMEKDHEALDQLLHMLHQRAQAAPSSLISSAILDTARNQAADLEALLHGHMQNEEEILVPCYLIYG